MDAEILNALKLVTHALSKTVKEMLPGYPEEQMMVAPDVSVANVRELITKAEKVN